MTCAPADESPDVVAVITQTEDPVPETLVTQLPGIDALPVGTELVDRAHAIRLQAELTRITLSRAALHDELTHQKNLRIEAQDFANKVQSELTEARQLLAECANPESIGEAFANAVKIRKFMGIARTRFAGGDE
jgi:hypothetical protein